MYIGVPPFGQTVRTITEKIAQQDQTIFYPDGGYIPGYVDIELDGAGLGSQDFTATDGLSVVLAQKAGAGSLFRSKAFWPVAMQDTMRRAEINAIVGAGNWAMRNRVINGDMRIDQRNAGAAVTVSVDSVFAVDRTPAGKGGAVNNFTLQQSSAAPTGFTKSLLATMSTGVTVGSTDYAYIRQAIEGYNVADFGLGTANSAAFTLSFWVRSSVAGTFGVSFRNSAANASWCSTYTISSANAWEYKTVSVAAGAINSGAWLTDNGTGLGVFWDLGVGATYSGTANQFNTGGNYFGVTGTTKLAATSGATFHITGVQLEKGSYATPFDQRPYGAELALCQRYFEKSYNLDTAVATTGTGQGLVDTTQNSNAGGNVSVMVSYKVPKRTTPTVNFYEITNASAFWFYGRSGTSGTVGMTAYGGYNSFYAYSNSIGANWTACEIYGHWTSSAEL